MSSQSHEYPLKGVVCSMQHQKIDMFVGEHAEQIGWLLVHFREKGRPFESVQDLLVDMLGDVIDVWVDGHRKNDLCLYDEVGALREITVRNRAIDDFKEDKEFVNLEDTREYCIKYLGENFDIGSFLSGDPYAISGDGINRLTVEGATWQELFPGRFED